MAPHVDDACAAALEAELRPTPYGFARREPERRSVASVECYDSLQLPKRFRRTDALGRRTEFMIK